jgi:O-antigen/teichoic acid export membrane protein
MYTRLISLSFIKYIVKSSAFVYLILEFISKAVPFLSIGLFTKLLDKTEFGRLSLYLSAVPILASLLHLSQVASIKLIFINYKNQLYTFLKNIILIIFFNALLLNTIVYFFNINFIDKDLVIISIYSGALFAVLELYLSYLNISLQKKNYSIIYLLKNILPYIISLILFSLNITNNAASFGHIQLFCFLLISAVILYMIFFYNATAKAFSTKYLKYSLKLSIPMIPVALSAYILTFSDRYVIDYYFSKKEVAEYTVAFTVASILTFVTLALNNVWQPYILRKLKHPNWKEINKTAYIYIGVISIVSIVVFLLQDVILLLVSSSSYSTNEVKKIIPILILSNFMHFLYTMFSGVLWFHQRMLLVPLPTVFAAGLNILLNFLLLPRYGYTAAAYTTLLSYTIQFFIIYMLCKRKLRTKLIL